MDKQLELLKSLTDVNGISGFEYDVKKLMKEYLTPVSDELIEDNLGSIFGKKKGNGSRTILIGGHLDEIGFMVTQIDDKGFIKFTPIGGWWSQVILSQKMTLVTDDGEYIGVVGSTPPHMLSPEARKKTVDIKDMYLDIGVKDKEEAESLGVKPGDMIVPYTEFTEMANKDYVLAKAFDNRFGCALAVEVLNELNDQEIDVNLVSGATVQEEVGLRGAQTAAHKVNPDLAIAIDVGIATDTPGLQTSDGVGVLGDGPLLVMLDATNIGHVGFRKHVQKLAKEKGIDVQLQAIPGGGTDAGRFHTVHDGVPSLAIGVPLRYMHSNVSIMHREDFKNAVKLVVEIVKSLNDDVVDNIKW